MLEWMRSIEQNQFQSSLDSTFPRFRFPANFNTKSCLTVLQEICIAVKRHGFVHYIWEDTPTDINASVVHLLGALNLRTSDSGVIRDSGDLSLLRDLTGSPKGRFPPYRSSSMNWHTDGYYNDSNQTVRCFTLHCVEPAAKGGTLSLIDDQLVIHELLSRHLGEAALLAHPEAMTLPANKDDLGHDRPDRTVPVIENNGDHTLSLRFTTRTQNISWRNEETRIAANRVADLLTNHPEWHTEITLSKGEGVITRNVLHARSEFTDEAGQPGRQILRGRFSNLPSVSTYTIDGEPHIKIKANEPSRHQTH